MSYRLNLVKYKCDCGRREVQKTLHIPISAIICQKLDPTGQVVCTRNNGHKGEHVACTLMDCEVLVWPDVPLIPKKIRQIRAL